MMNVYAEFVERQEPILQVELPEFYEDGIDESDLVGLIDEFRDFYYAPRGARYPFEINGIRVKLSPPRKNNCCTFVEALVIGDQLQVRPDEVFPVDAVVLSGKTEVDESNRCGAVRRHGEG